MSHEGAVMGMHKGPALSSLGGMKASHGNAIWSKGALQGGHWRRLSSTEGRCHGGLSWCECPMRPCTQQRQHRLHAMGKAEQGWEPHSPATPSTLGPRQPPRSGARRCYH